MEEGTCSCDVWKINLLYLAGKELKANSYTYRFHHHTNIQHYYSSSKMRRISTWRKTADLGFLRSSHGCYSHWTASFRGCPALPITPNHHIRHPFQFQYYKT
ncbi:hypothetical protein H5410_050242 [Solanum commersonii]|uniref:Uncharacterized protein n=1 Tax=Solanum commersonii TaxID=4109 RepID=A0A9J5WW90_SOLCO|nr:hypothetical protein H5410_050242 [Solanum commersonii]